MRPVMAVMFKWAQIAVFDGDGETDGRKDIRTDKRTDGRTGPFTVDALKTRWAFGVERVRSEVRPSVLRIIS